MSEVEPAADGEGACPNCGSTAPGITTRGPGEHFTACCGERASDWEPVWVRR